MMRIYVKVKPNASSNEIKKLSKEELEVRLTASPEKGKANAALVNLLAKYFEVSKSSVKIVGGKSSRNKMVDIE